MHNKGLLKCYKITYKKCRKTNLAHQGKTIQYIFQHAAAFKSCIQYSCTLLLPLLVDRVAGDHFKQHKWNQIDIFMPIR